MSQDSEKQRYSGIKSTRSGLSSLRWGRILIGGIAPHMLWEIVLTVFIFVEIDATVATWIPWGISEGLINWFGSWGIYTAILFGATAASAAIIGRTVPSEVTVVHGVLVGMVAASITLTLQPLGLVAVVLFVLTVAAGWVGQFIGR
jgi:hypothetical protein